MTGRWHRSAERENARRVAEAPLLAHAGLVALTTPEEREARHQHSQATFEAMRREHRAQQVARLEELRAKLGAEVSALAEATVRRHGLGIEYSLDALHRAAIRVDQGLSALEPEAQPFTEAEAAESQERTRRLLACWAQADKAFYADHPEMLARRGKYDPELLKALSANRRCWEQRAKDNG